MEPIPDISKLNINDSTTTNTTTNTNTTPNKKPQQQNSKQAPKVALLTEEQIKKCLPILKCEVKDCNIQMNLDHFNNGLPIHMVINKETNDFVIVKVDNQELEEYQLIYSVPKIQSFKKDVLIQQQKSESSSSSAGADEEDTTVTTVTTVTTTPTITKFNSYYISNKWNGMNIQVFKYNGADGKVYISAKPRASPFIQNDLKSGPIIDLINEIFSRDQIEITTENDGNYFKVTTNFNTTTTTTTTTNDGDDGANTNKLMVPKLIEPLFLKKEKEIQSIVFELCGSKLPHIVKYDFDIDLKPLFTISTQGGLIKPIIDDNSSKDNGQIQFVQYVKINNNNNNNNNSEEEDNKKLIELIDEIKINLLKENQEFRKVNGLSENMIWFNHFLQEGRVLYLLNDQGTLVNHRQIYSIKPKDAEKSHWEQFDNGIQTKLLMTVKEMSEKSITIDRDTLRKELDLDQVSWTRHENDICSLALPPVVATPLSKSKLVITCGLPACGKSYFAQAISERSSGAWKRINQDDLGTRKKCEDLLKQYLKAGHNVIIDRCNQDIGQRRNWIKLAASLGVAQVHLIWFTIDQTICKGRIVVRENHPTIPKGDEGIAIIDKFLTMFVPPSEFEGFASLTQVSSEQESNDLIEKYISTIDS
ncbi:hypothetical protein ACTFIW_005609 [Dictyostelium discoideum]